MTAADLIDDQRRARGLEPREVGIFPRLKPSTQTISLRLPELLLENLKMLANKRDVPYQSLLKIFLAERIEEELRRRS